MLISLFLTIALDIIYDIILDIFISQLICIHIDIIFKISIFFQSDVKFDTCVFSEILYHLHLKLRR